MNLRLLREITKDYPNNAKVYREADHGQQPEGSPSIRISRQQGKLPYYGEDIVWESRDSFPHSEITAINIC